MRARAPEASVKSIWELIRNAYDVANSGGKQTLTVRTRVDDSSFILEHDAGTFTVDEVNAPITGGTTQPYESEELVGRYGKGLLTTHVISSRVDVAGWVKEVVPHATSAP